MKKIAVNQDECIGCGYCVSVDGDDFEFNAEGLSQAKVSEISDDNKAAIDASEGCPVNAIKISE